MTRKFVNDMDMKMAKILAYPNVSAAFQAMIVKFDMSAARYLVVSTFTGKSRGSLRDSSVPELRLSPGISDTEAAGRRIRMAQQTMLNSVSSTSRRFQMRGREKPPGLRFARSGNRRVPPDVPAYVMIFHNLCRELLCAPVVFTRFHCSDVEIFQRL
jgi:hypothetical protein